MDLCRWKPNFLSWHNQTSVLQWLLTDPASCTKLLWKANFFSTKVQVQCFNIWGPYTTCHWINDTNNHYFFGYINNHLVVLKETPYSIIISMVSIYICQDKKYLLQSTKKNRVLLMQCQLQLWKKRANSAKAKSWNEHTLAESKIKRLDSSNDYLTHNTHYINQGTFSTSKDTKKSERWENFVVRAKLIPKSFKYISKSTMNVNLTKPNSKNKASKANTTYTSNS